MFKVGSLQKRLFLFLLFPVAVLLIAMGLLIFVYARESLLTQWKEAATLKLERAARDVDARLSGPVDWMEMFHGTAGEPRGDAVRAWVVKQLEGLNGVERVTVTGAEKQAEAGSRAGQCPIHPQSGKCYTWSRGGDNPWMERWMGEMEFERAEIAGISLPRYDELIAHETVTLASDLLDRNGKAVGRLEVAIRFQYLIEGALKSGWSQSERAFLVSGEGKVLACNVSEEAEKACYDEAVRAAVEAMQKKTSGTIIHPDRSREDVVGFYRLKEAPWSLVVVAPSNEILAPISRFRLIYFAVAAGFFCLILLIIRLVAGRTVSSIQAVSGAAKRVSMGHFDALPPARSGDEVGQLIESFNEMVLQLDERIRLKEALDLAMRVQQSLLPLKPPSIKGLDIAGESIYCDETGGDYFDFITFPEWDSRRVGIVVGDVAGHGISAALFMTTTRALLRSRITLPGSLSEVMCHVNRLLCNDTSNSGDFMSLFLVLADTNGGNMRWVRAGHAPGLVYDWASDSFEELREEGVALGFDETCTFKEYEYPKWNGTKLLFLGTDGIWEAENPRGEMFGMDRLRTVIREHHRESSKEIIQALTDSLAAFRETSPQEDDITAVVVKSSSYEG